MKLQWFHNTKSKNIIIHFRSQQSEILVNEMKQELEKYKDQLKTANSELDAQRSKNDVSVFESF